MVKGPRAEPGCEQGHPPNLGGSAPHPRTAGRDPQGGASPPPQRLCQGRPGLGKRAVWAGSASVTDGATCLLQRGDPGARRGASERVSQAGRGPAHPRPCWPPLPTSQGCLPPQQAPKGPLPRAAQPRRGPEPTQGQGMTPPGQPHRMPTAPPGLRGPSSQSYSFPGGQRMDARVTP